MSLKRKIENEAENKDDSNADFNDSANTANSDSADAELNATDRLDKALNYVKTRFNIFDEDKYFITGYKDSGNKISLTLDNVENTISVVIKRASDAGIE